MKCIARLLVFAFLFSLLSAPAAAQKLYRYRDSTGKLLFSDRPVAGQAPLAVTPVEPAQAPERFGLRLLGPKDRSTLRAVNEYRGPVQVEISLAEAANIVSSRPLPARFVVPDSGDLDLLTVRPANPRFGWSWRYQYRYLPGDPHASHHPPGPYLVPFAPGLSFPVSQGFDGAVTHTDPANRYAVDIAMPEGTPIRAARGGRIMEVANDFISGGFDATRYLEKANFIRILHDDGTMAIYAHLRPESCRFPVGSRVSAGQIIGESGNTGFSGGPHLHFVIQRNAGMKMVSDPFLFAGASGQGFAPHQGQVLTAF